MIYNDVKITNKKPTQFDDNVGIGTTHHATYKLDTNGTSRFIGNVGIDTEPHPTYKLDTNGTSRFTDNVVIGTIPHSTCKVDVNGTLNVTNLLINGSVINQSKWTTGTPSTRIYYNGGNVGIGTTDPSNILQVGSGSRLRIANDITD